MTSTPSAELRKALTAQGWLETGDLDHRGLHPAIDLKMNKSNTCLFSC